MEHKYKLVLIISLPSLLFLLLALIFVGLFCFGRRKTENGCRDVEMKLEGNVEIREDLVRFEGGEALSVVEILDAPGEVIGKSCYGTLYRAILVNSNSLTLLRFLRPTCTLRVKEVIPVVELLGNLRHQNLVPLMAFYAGPKGEKLMVHPFYSRGNLAQFIRDGNGEGRRWETICRISMGIARGLHHLHTCLEKPIPHGNLKSKNVLMDEFDNAYVSDFGLHLVLNPCAGQQMLEVSEREGYKAPELIKMKDACEESDIYSLGVILFELLSGKEAMDLPSVMRSAILDVDLFHPDILLGLTRDQRVATEDAILRFLHLAMACCSPSRPLRPDAKQILEKLEEIAK